jgi:signal transduction histidine kinase
MMMSVRAWIARYRVMDWAVCLFTAFVTVQATPNKAAPWFPHAVIVPLALGQGLALLARRRRPTAVLAATTLIGAFLLAVGYPAGAMLIGVCCAAYAVGVYRSTGSGPELAETMRAAAYTLLAGIALLIAGLQPNARNQGFWNAAVDALLVAASWILGYAIQTRRAYIAGLKERAERLEAEEGERAARAVLDERLRIARELHDVIGHSISLITLQAEAAARAARTDPQAVPGFLTTIAAAGRQALGEMRGVLAVLRPDTAAEMSPAPGLEQIGDLVAQLGAGGGLHARLDMEPINLPPGLALTVYRIVQESLTNVLKHAGQDATAAVTIARSGGALRVRVRDDGAGPHGPAMSTAHGIVGMRERVSAYGGTLTTGARPEGGFEVVALIPLPRGAAAA